MAERVRRSKEELVQEYERKIAYHQGMVSQLEEKIAVLTAKLEKHQNAAEKLEAKKENTLNPKPRVFTRKRTGMKSVMDKAKEMGMTADQIAEKLGISLN